MARSTKPKNPLIDGVQALPPVPDIEVLPFAAQPTLETESVITATGEMMTMPVGASSVKTTVSEVPDSGIDWDDPAQYPSDVNIFPVYETISERVRNERTGTYGKTEETRAKVNFVLLKMDKDIRGVAGSIQGKEIAECIKLPCRASSFKKFLGEKFTVKDVIGALAAHPGAGKDFWFAPVTAEQAKLEADGKKHRLSKMGLDYAQSEASRQMGQKVNHQIFGNPAVIENTFV